MCVLFIFYFIYQFGFDDNYVISLFSVYVFLVYVIFIFGGWFVDCLFGNCIVVIVGVLLMIFGYVVLGIDINLIFSLYLVLVIIICGYGLFKLNISCLFGEFYDENDY